MTSGWLVPASLLIGAFLSGVGLILVAIGGWGPCGPAGLTSEVGGVLCANHLILYSTLFPRLGAALSSSGSGPLNLCFFFVVAALDWAVIAFLVLSCANGLRRLLIKGYAP